MSDAVTARLLVEARQRSGISQAELARRARVPRSVVNAYERNHREPGAGMLARLLAAAGFELRLVPAPCRIDAERAGRILAQVLDLAEVLPSRRKGRLTYPPFLQRTS